MFGPANQRLPPIFTHCSRRGADGPENGFVPATPNILNRRGERTLESTRQTGRELLAARVLPALAQTELLPFSSSTPQRTTCRGALPLPDKNMRWMRRKISSPPASLVWLERIGTTAVDAARSTPAGVQLSDAPASMSSCVINSKFRLMEGSPCLLEATCVLPMVLATAPEVGAFDPSQCGLDWSTLD